jgi:hypothetical protein
MHRNSALMVLSITEMMSQIFPNKAGVQVKSVVCDGAKSNKKCMNLAGIDGSMDNLIHYFDHPALKDQKVYCFYDVPHIYKCVRNNMLLNGITQVRATIYFIILFF